MTWPIADVSTTALDAGTDTPPREEFKSWADKFNDMRGHVSALGQTFISRSTAALMRNDLGIKVQSFAYIGTASNTAVGASFVDLSFFTVVQKGTALLSDTFTAPRAGWVRVAIGSIHYILNSGTITSVGVRVRKSGSYQNPEFFVTSVGAQTGFIYIAQVAAGDTIKIGARSTGTSPVASVTCAGVEISMLDYE